MGPTPWRVLLSATFGRILIEVVVDPILPIGARLDRRPVLKWEHKICLIQQYGSGPLDRVFDAEPLDSRSIAS